MSEYKSYTIITRDEAIRLNTFDKIIIPSKDRYIDGRLSKEQVSKLLSEHLIALGMRETSNYLLARFPVLNGASCLMEGVITLSLSDLDSLFCLDEDACGFYRDKVGGGHYYACTDIVIDIANVIQTSNKNRVRPILVEAFQFTDSELDKFSTNAQSRLMRALSKFKRECLLKKEDLSFLNDVVTFATIMTPYGTTESDDKTSKAVQLYRAGQNIAEPFPLLQKLIASTLNNKKDILSELEDCLHSGDTHLRWLEDNLRSMSKKTLVSENHFFSYTVLCLMYLKVKALYRESEDNQPNEILRVLITWYNDIGQKNHRVTETKLALYCLITEFGWSAFADSFYQWKQLATFQKPSSYESISDTAITLKQELNESNNKVQGLRDTLADKQRELTDNQNKVQDLEDTLADKQRELTDNQNKVQDLEDTLADKQRELTDSQNKAQDLEGTLADKQRELTDSQNKVQDLEDTLADKQRELTDSQNKVQDLEDTLADKQRELTDNQNKVQDLEDTLTTKEQELADIKNELQRITNEWRRTKSLLHEKNAVVEKLSTQSTNVTHDKLSTPVSKKTLHFSTPQSPAQINRLNKTELLGLCQKLGVVVEGKPTNAELKKKLIEELTNHEANILSNQEITKTDLFKLEND